MPWNTRAKMGCVYPLIKEKEDLQVMLPLKILLMQLMIFLVDFQRFPLIIVVSEVTSLLIAGTEYYKTLPVVY